ncbi:MAG: OmpA family protein [Candidatus Berkiella sp.]
MHFSWCHIVAFLSALSLAQYAHAHEYKAPINNSHWKTSGSKLECTLTYTIPAFGTATFSQGSHQKQRLVVESILDRLQPGKAKLQAYPQSWKYDNRVRKIGQVNVKPGTQPITMKDLPVYQLLESLALGQSAAFVITPANTAHSKHESQKDTVVLLPVGFQKAYKEYLNCISKMIPHSFSELKEVVLHFESGSAILSTSDESKLKELGAFIRADGKIRKIAIEGHADRKGSFQANNYLANQRMWAVKDFLVQHHGASADIFTLKDYADKVPVASNKTAAGRAKNRRVVIKLYR